jgi:hypothetical protein
MDNLDNKTPLQPGESDLRAQYDSLRHLVTSILVLVVVISGTLNIYLLRQWRSTSNDLKVIRPQAAHMLAEYQKISGPRMENFVKQLTEYGQTHADFAPILAKYHIKPSAPSNAPPATATHPPAAAPKR